LKAESLAARWSRKKSIVSANQRPEFEKRHRHNRFEESRPKHSYPAAQEGLPL
jgi:hypothetical protein